MTPDHDTALADQVLTAAPHCTALPPNQLTAALNDPPPPDPTDHARQLAALRGALVVAAATVTDQLLDDIAALATGEDITDTAQLAALPPRFAHHYTPAFARQFLVAFLDLTTRLTANQWTPPSCVAQELGVCLLLDHTDVIADLTALPLPTDWHDTLLDLLVEDTDHEYLYDPALDGFEDDPHFGPPGMTPMRIQDWFTPYPGHQPLPPYLALIHHPTDPRPVTPRPPGPPAAPPPPVRHLTTGATYRPDRACPNVAAYRPEGATFGTSAAISDGPVPSRLGAEVKNVAAV